MSDIHGDEQQDTAMLEPIVTVIKQILDKMAAMDEEISALGKLVNEEIIGGITNLYNSKQRSAGIDGLQEKYGPVMGQYKDFYQDLKQDGDIYGDLYDDLDELKASSADWNDEAEASRVNELADMLKQKLESMKGHIGGMSEQGSPDSGAVSIEVGVAKPGEDASANSLIEKIRQMKKKTGDVKF